MAGGGVSSTFDPLDVTQYAFEEMKAAGDTAESRNTNVSVSVFTNAPAQQAL